ncbi:hypothetical protein HPELS_00880 [Helicobacter pylori ELS37]|uniref:Uncharacterized protein n=1 Tax=Helicobacter pylori ELS37 TaxID=1055527 RepID=A0ABC7ZE26_HELPX|nr:hypothetical protein HPELS_00880 [Helicobacter pylori ELS37]
MHATIITNIIFIIASRIVFSFPKKNKTTPPKRIKQQNKKIINIVTPAATNTFTRFEWNE